MKIRHIAVSPFGAFAAAGEFERRVHLWSLTEARQLASLETVLDFGGARLAISSDGQIVAGAYRVYGIESYRSSTQSDLVWRRRDLKKVQHIKFSADEQRVICSFEGTSCRELNSQSGKEFQPRVGVRDLWDSPYDPVRLVEKKPKMILEDISRRSIGDIPRETFALLSVAFGPGRICLSESGGPVRCIETHSGKEIWRFQPPLGQHFLRVGFVEHLQVFAGVCWPYERGGPKTLQHFEPNSGNATVVGQLRDCCECEFCLRGSRLITSNGEFIDTTTGQECGQIE